MITYPHAKINLGLNVVSKREDGYHNLETVFYPVQWCDIMELHPGPRHSKGIEVHMSGLRIAGKHADNLCVKAYQLLRHYYSVPAVKLYLHKQVPIGAGLGGGSSDAAFFMKKMNELFSLGISDDDMRALVMKLGSDCAFFIDGKPVYAEERGDKFTPIDFSLEGRYVVIVYPEIHIATSTAFANMTPGIPEYNCADIVKRHPIETWKDLLTNDFEKTVFKVHPEVEALKNKLYDSGAIYASMSGSGSAVYGIFEKSVPDLQFEDLKIRKFEMGL
jgi:4-diphosphocytidyl-2-C-methyl-D-erythritol kinase